MRPSKLAILQWNICRAFSTSRQARNPSEVVIKDSRGAQRDNVAISTYSYANRSRVPVEADDDNTATSIKKGSGRFSMLSRGIAEKSTLIPFRQRSRAEQNEIEAYRKGNDIRMSVASEGTGKAPRNGVKREGTFTIKDRRAQPGVREADRLERQRRRRESQASAKRSSSNTLGERQEGLDAGIKSVGDGQRVSNGDEMAEVAAQNTDQVSTSSQSEARNETRDTLWQALSQSLRGSREYIDSAAEFKRVTGAMGAAAPMQDVASDSERKKQMNIVRSNQTKGIATMGSNEFIMTKKPDNLATSDVALQADSKIASSILSGAEAGYIPHSEIAGSEATMRRKAERTAAVIALRHADAVEPIKVLQYKDNEDRESNSTSSGPQLNAVTPKTKHGKLKKPMLARRVSHLLSEGKKVGAPKELEQVNSALSSTFNLDATAPETSYDDDTREDEVSQKLFKVEEPPSLISIAGGHNRGSASVLPAARRLAGKVSLGTASPNQMAHDDYGSNDDLAHDDARSPLTRRLAGRSTNLDARTFDKISPEMQEAAEMSRQKQYGNYNADYSPAWSNDPSLGSENQARLGYTVPDDAPLAITESLLPFVQRNNRSYISIIADADQLFFLPQFTLRGARGAYEACKLIHRGVERDLGRSIDRERIRIKLLCNLGGLRMHLLRTYEISIENFSDFNDAYLHYSPFNDFSHCGKHHGAADIRVKANLVNDAFNPDCERIYIGGLGDYGYLTDLYQMKDDHDSEAFGKLRFLCMPQTLKNSPFHGVFKQKEVSWGYNVFMQQDNSPSRKVLERQMRRRV